MSGVPRQAQGPEHEAGIQRADNIQPAQEVQDGNRVQGRGAGLQARTALPPIWLAIQTWICTYIFLGCVDVQASCAHSVTTGWRDHFFPPPAREPPQARGWFSWAWHGIVRCITSIVRAVFVIVVVVLFCLALFMVAPHAVKGCSWLLERLSVYALLFSETSKWFSGYLETTSQTAYNSSVSAWEDLAFLRSLQSHEKDFIQRMREGKVRDSTELEAELATAKKKANDLQSQLATAERDANVLKGNLATAEKDVNNLKGKLATSQKETTDLRSKFEEVVGESMNLKDELVKTKTQGCPALTHMLENSYEMLSKSRGLDKEWDTDF
jgi:hypothetical protein